VPAVTFTDNNNNEYEIKVTRTGKDDIEIETRMKPPKKNEKWGPWGKVKFEGCSSNVGNPEPDKSAPAKATGQTTWIHAKSGGKGSDAIRIYCPVDESGKHDKTRGPTVTVNGAQMSLPNGSDGEKFQKDLVKAVEDLGLPK
jgi:hypothetical protein